jgi:hypothetical protein
MKYIVVIFVLELFFLSAYSQSRDTSSFVLGVEKEYLTYKKAFVFKPHSSLKIMTEDENKYSSSNYTFSESYIVMNLRDTILFNEILWVKGRVYRDIGRKITGATIALCTVPVGYISVISVAFGGGPVFLTALPFIGIIYGGLRLTGARKFHRTNDCYVKTIEMQKK